jgi:oligoribonuclease NrnB/cAMP/cGMP phosphodiesterase (DHH superfamily)
VLSFFCKGCVIIKILLISHISDPDGITPIILSKLTFNKVDYILLDAAEVNNKVEYLIINNEFDKYDAVFITDLGLNEETSNIIENNINLKSKVKIFDHHIGNKLNKDYSFTTIIDIDSNGIKQSGTSLYYDYLLKNYNNKQLEKDSVRHFVTLVREYDTWTWVKSNNIEAKHLANLFDLYGRELFEEHYLSFLRENDTFYFDEKELFLLEIENNKINTYINEAKSRTIPVNVLGHKAGLVFASQYRSELGNQLAVHFKEVFDFIIIVNIERSISYRGIKDIDLNKIATFFGGKGHINSSGSPLPDNINQELIKIIFNNNVTIIQENQNS